MPIETPPDFAVAERIVKRLEPIDSIFSWTDLLAPDPIASIIITAATPIIIPSEVRAERILLTFKELSAICNVDL